MTSIRLESIELYEDVQTIHNYHRYFTKDPVEKRMQRVWQSSRDASRTPMQWDGSENAGFSSGKPWFFVNPNYPEINAAAQENDPDSLLNFYREAVRLRKELPVVRYGSFRLFQPLSGKLLIYERRSKSQRLLVICSYSDQAVRVKAPKGYDLSRGTLILRSHGDELDKNGYVAQPWETRVYLFQDRKKRVDI